MLSLWKTKCMQSNVSYIWVKPLRRLWSIHSADDYINILLQIYDCAEISTIPLKGRMFNWMQVI
jgi:hypothetical protein